MNSNINFSDPAIKKLSAIFIIIILVLIAGGTYLGYFLIQQEKNKTVSTIAGLNDKIKTLEEASTKLKEENDNINAILSEEQKKTLELEAAKKESEQTINRFEKLTSLDPELLKKYSKIYFLNENYTPPELKEIDTEYLINPDKPLQIMDKVYPYLNRMLKKANADGVNLRVLSAYRSFQEQKNLKSNYSFTYGAGTANQFSADQGYSEHQMGTTVDFTTPTLVGTSVYFENSTAYAWLQKNAYKYGFVLSYPKGNAYYMYEPWHWRFVGEDLAKDLKDDGKYFYELDQRELDTYLIKIFD